MLALFITCVLLAQPAFALSLDQAKSQGLLGETPSGYLEAVKPEAAVVALLQDINAKRREEYESIAKKNGTALHTVEALAGKQALEKTAPGNYIKVDGKWLKK